MKTFIYALCEPETRTIRYIGKAKNPTQRLKQHCWPSKPSNNHLGYWLRSLRRQSKLPTLIVLKEVLCVEWEEWERRYIRCARALGFNLVNSTDGGDCGTDGYKHTKEAKKKMRLAKLGTIHTPEHCEKMRVSMLGKNLGKKRTLEWRQAKSIAMSGKYIGRKLSPVSILRRTATRSFNRLLKICQPLE